MAFDDEADYYDAGGIETIDIIRAKLTPEEFRGYVKGTVLKYLCRAAFKHEDQERDLEKAANMAALLRVPRTPEQLSLALESEEQLKEEARQRTDTGPAGKRIDLPTLSIEEQEQILREAQLAFSKR
jgi:hypothetical protein